MNETLALGAVGKLLGRLLVREIDAATASRLASPAIADALDDLGLALPVPDRLDQLAADYFEAVVNPKRHPPLVQSLCEDGRYESTASVSVRQIAAAAGVELDADLARGAPPDHLGVELLLWAELAERSPWARDFADRHLAWASRPLELMAATTGGFYGGLALVVRRFIGVVTAPEAR